MSEHDTHRKSETADADGDVTSPATGRLPSTPSAGHVIGGILAGLEGIVTGRPKAIPHIEEQYGEDWASAEGMTVEGLDEPIERHEPPDRSGAKL